MHRNLAFITLILCVFSSAAQAEFYGTLKASYFTGVDDFDDEQSFGLVFGKQFNDIHAVELEAQINGFDSTDPGFEVDADVFTYLLNYNYTFWNEGNWRAKLGAGIGFADAEFGISADERGDDNPFVWQVGAEADYHVSDNFSATFGLRVQDFGEASDGGVTYEVGTPVVVSVGLRYNF